MISHFGFLAIQWKSLSSIDQSRGSDEVIIEFSKLCTNNILLQGVREAAILRASH
jgi:hypothetical protein